MKINMNGLTRSINRVGLGLRKRSPEILVAAGVVGVVASTVMACKATTKIDDILGETKERVKQVNTLLEHPEMVEAEYTEEDGKKDLAIIYTQTGVELFKLYAPSIALGTLSIAAIVTSNRILRKRNVALAAAYTVVDKSFKEYRSRVIERFGEELDKELKYNIKAKEIEEVVVDADGNEQTVKSVVQVADPVNEYSEYARFFDDGNTGWKDNAEYNLMFLRQQQAFANEKLQAKGYLFLNEVYDMLGIPQTRAGQVVGWIYDTTMNVGDNYVDFGIYDITKETHRDFVNGREKTILLDFNVDGPILEYLGEE